MIWKRATTARHVYADNEIAANIWAVLAREPSIHARALNDIAVEVVDGTAKLSGHVSAIRHRIEDLVRRVPGVRRVENGLVNDDALRVQVSLSLARDPRTRRLDLHVTCLHGWIRVYGAVPGSAEGAAVEEVASGNPCVRGVLLFAEWGQQHQHGELDRQPVQPEIGATVYARDGKVGQVSRAIIHPRNRLVSHIAMAEGYGSASCTSGDEFVLPVALIERVTVGGIFLKGEGGAVGDFPRFSGMDFPPAPAGWQPPFPYRLRHVRWPRIARQRWDTASTLAEDNNEHC